MALSSFRNAGLSNTNTKEIINANFSNTATGTYTSSSVNYKYVTFTGNGTLTITTSGIIDTLIISGGQSGQGSKNGDGGAQCFGGSGGHNQAATFYLTAGSYTVTVGAGGAGSFGYASQTVGNPSTLGPSTMKSTGTSITSALNNSSTTYSNAGPNGIGTSYGNGTNATANTGNGGGGSLGGNPAEVKGGNGGSGIVIVRVAV